MSSYPKAGLLLPRLSQCLGLDLSIQYLVLRETRRKPTAIRGFAI
jgi:hypothetical protein